MLFQHDSPERLPAAISAPGAASRIMDQQCGQAAILVHLSTRALSETAVDLLGPLAEGGNPCESKRDGWRPYDITLGVPGYERNLSMDSNVYKARPGSISAWDRRSCHNQREQGRNWRHYYWIVVAEAGRGAVAGYKSQVRGSLPPEAVHRHDFSAERRIRELRLKLDHETDHSGQPVPRSADQRS